MTNWDHPAGSARVPATLASPARVARARWPLTWEVRPPEISPEISFTFDPPPVTRRDVLWSITRSAAWRLVVAGILVAIWVRVSPWPALALAALWVMIHAAQIPRLPRTPSRNLALRGSGLPERGRR